MCDKTSLRRTIRAAYGGDAQRESQSQKLCAHIAAHQWWQNAKTVAAYVPLKREADVSMLLALALAQKKTLALPRVEKDGIMTFRRVDDLAKLTPGAYGIPEPPVSLPIISPGQLDLMIVPLEALDGTGMRLGKGGGYYDRVLATIPCKTIGAVLNWQWTEHVPADPWDRALHAAADENGITLFEQERND